MLLHKVVTACASVIAAVTLYTRILHSTTQAKVQLLVSCSGSLTGPLGLPSNMAASARVCVDIHIIMMYWAR